MSCGRRAGPRIGACVGRVLAACLALAAPGAALADQSVGGLDPASVESWKLPKADLYGVAVLDDRVWAVGYWGTVLTSTDRGASFTHRATPTRETLFAVSFADAQTGWAVGGRGTILHTTDGGATWQRQVAEVQDEFGDTYPLESPLFGVTAVSPTDVWAVGDLGVVLHSRDGQAWERVQIPPESFADENLLERIFNAVHFDDADNGWIAGEFGTLLRTQDGGQTWTGERELLDAPEEAYLFNLSVSEPSVRSSDLSASAERFAASVGLAGTVLVSDDGGRSWRGSPAPTRAGLFSIASRGRSAVAVGDRGVIFVTQDGGETWVEAERPKIFGWLGDVAYGSDSEVFVVGAGGAVWRSRDGGRRFEALSTLGASTTPRPSTEAASLVRNRTGEGE